MVRKCSQQFKENLAEMMASFIFVFVGGAVVAVTGDIDSDGMECSRVLTVALTDGFLFYSCVALCTKLCGGKGGYGNAALTAALCALDFWGDGYRQLFAHFKVFARHVLTQTVGAALGALLLVLAVPRALVGTERTGGPYLLFPAHTPGGGMTWMSASVLSILLTWIFVMVVMAQRNNNEQSKPSLLLCLCYTVVRMLAFPLTLDPLNPVRTTAHAILAGRFDATLILFVMAPMVGAVLGVISFVTIHATPDAA